jgi:hypothetical protein
MKQSREIIGPRLSLLSFHPNYELAIEESDHTKKAIRMTSGK